MKNAYDILGIKESASDGEIRDAYLELVKTKHPDKHGNSKKATAEFEEVKSSYDILKDRDLRDKHDFALAKFRGKDIPQTSIDESLSDWFDIGEQEQVSPPPSRHRTHQRTQHGHDRRMPDEPLPDGCLGRTDFFGV